MNDDDNCIHKYYAPFFSKNHEYVSSGSEYDSVKWTVRCHKNIILNLLLNESKSYEWKMSLLFFVLKNKKLSSHMDQIGEHINSSNHKSHSHYQMRKIIVNIGNKKCKNKNNSTCQLTRLHNLILMSIVDTLKKYFLFLFL